MSHISSIDNRLFWWGLYLAPALWAVLGMVALLKFSLEWLLLVIIALMLNGANVIGYTKCNKQAKAKIAGFLSSGAALAFNSGLFASQTV